MICPICKNEMAQITDPRVEHVYQVWCLTVDCPMGFIPLTEAGLDRLVRVLNAEYFAGFAACQVKAVRCVWGDRGAVSSIRGLRPTLPIEPNFQTDKVV